MDANSFTLDCGESTVTLRLSDAANGRIDFSCSTCTVPCEHVGAALSLILEEKLALRLAAAPKETVPLENLSDTEMIQRALADRAERARTEKMSLSPLDGRCVGSDYAVTSDISGKTYRVALRGWERGESYCSCPDFKSNTLGTCKHLIFVIGAVKKKLPKGLKPRPYKRTRITLHVRYGDKAVTNVDDLMVRIRKLERLGHPVHVSGRGGDGQRAAPAPEAGRNGDRDPHEPAESCFAQGASKSGAPSLSDGGHCIRRGCRKGSARR